MRRHITIHLLPVLAIAYFSFLTPGFVWGAADEQEGHSHEESDHEEFEYLYGNHLCPTCDYTDRVDPHYFVDISNKKVGIFARVYLCSPDCGDEIEKNMAKYYMEIYRTDKETKKEKPALDLKNKTCPMDENAVDAKTTIEYNGMIVGFCSKDCSEAFLKEPEKGMAKILPEAKEFKFETDAENEAHDEGDGHSHE